MGFQSQLYAFSRFVRYLVDCGMSSTQKKPEFLSHFHKKILRGKYGSRRSNGFEIIRRRLLASKDSIEIKDFGAGSLVEKGNQRSIASIAKYSLQTPRFCNFLFRLCEYYQPSTIIELGTSFGIATLYLADSTSVKKVFTVEGCPATAKIAQQNFSSAGLEKIDLQITEFDAFIQNWKSKNQSIDLLYVDGNHQFAPTVRYYEELAPLISKNGIVIFDDIHLSPQMTAAWEALKKSPQAAYSVDLFRLGILFFGNEKKQKHHTLWFSGFLF